MIIHSLKRNLACSALPRRFYSSATTVDSSEVAQFANKFSADWWDEFGSAKGLHSMNKLRVPFIRDGLINQMAVPKENVNTATPLKGLTVLDVGCGGGILSEALSRLGAQVTGIDATSNIIDVAKQHAKKSGLDINYIHTSIEEHSKENVSKYDAVAASEVIEHVTEKEKFISACADCLKPSGSIFFTTLNKTFLANVLAVCVAEDVMGLVPKGTHNVEKFIEPHKLQRMLEDCNVHTVLIHGMIYNFVTNRWDWCRNTSVDYCLHAVKG